MSWAEGAACRGKPTEWWFPMRGNDPDKDRALALCRTCDVQVQCLNFAMRHRDLVGIFGGTDSLRREQMRRNRARRRACQWCGCLFWPKRPDQLYCEPRHARALYNLRARQKVAS